MGYAFASTRKVDLFTLFLSPHKTENLHPPLTFGARSRSNFIYLRISLSQCFRYSLDGPSSFSMNGVPSGLFLCSLLSSVPP